jgi:hypothetical protein
MKGWVRKLRGIAGTGTVWGLACATVGFLLGGIGAVVAGNPFFGTVLSMGLGLGSTGFFLGCGFAGVLSLMEGRRTLSDLSPARAAAWGAVAGGILPSLNVLLVVGLGRPIEPDQLVLVSLVGGLFTGAVGAGLAAGTVSLARRAHGELDSGPPLDMERLGPPTVDCTVVGAGGMERP